MYRDSLGTRILAAVLVIVLAVFSAGFTWAAVDDYATRDVMPQGAVVDGVSVAGLTRADAVRVVEEKVKGPLLAPVTVTFLANSYTIDPKEYAEVDVEGMLDEAAAPKVSSTLPERVWQRVSSAPVGNKVERKMRVDSAKLAAWAESTRLAASIAAVDASVSISGSRVTFIQAKDGSTIDTTAAVTTISTALLAGTKAVDLPVLPVPPRVDDKKLGKTIVVVRSKKTLTLYNGATVEKAYRCAVGTPGFPTPLGTWKIINKRYRPTWTNPGSDWAKSMPAYIPPGPGNPLGTRALDLNASGIRIHGTNKDWSIGTAASHGCMRMHMRDVEELYELVPVGTRVIIVR